MNKLARERVLKGLTQSELAWQANINLRMVQQLEQGKKNINTTRVDIIYKICKVLECDMEDILEIDEIIMETKVFNVSWRFKYSSYLNNGLLKVYKCDESRSFISIETQPYKQGDHFVQLIEIPSNLIMEQGFLSYDRFITVIREIKKRDYDISGYSIFS